MGVKEDFILAQIIINLFLVAINLVCHCDLQPSDSVGPKYRLDNGLFNVRHLLAKTKTSCVVIFALQYADDAAFPSFTSDGSQRCLDVISETYLRAGLVVNVTKTEVLNALSIDAPTFSISRNKLNNSEILIYIG